ncbi:MAG: 3-deoxy-manno-octulosonate cytidylyltransferase [Flavobacteriales bacterium]|jgi:3-deoxy-manno-octulosonate cytidylyltransferase (CMP-KDO synthetase)|nr:3-deoxy-manno-octulosonate cytidylyltransferase [Flavobacteriales bacterium]
MRILGIIPARFASTRFPGKPLAMIHGKAMIQRVYEQALKAEELAEVWVATDDDRIAEFVAGFGGNVVTTLPDHITGTERCHEALQKIGLADAVVNIQGDEPYIAPAQINEVARLLQKAHVEIATVVKRIEDAALLLDPNKVKVVMGKNNRALYFSRSAIPFYRGESLNDWVLKHDFYKHIGLYGYKADALRQIVHFEPTALEIAESLEQLRWLENGKEIHCVISSYESMSVDTLSDLEEIERTYAE